MHPANFFWEPCHTRCGAADVPPVHVAMSTASKPVPFGPDLRSALIAMVRKRVPESEVEDIVQQALAEAIESPHAPQDSESLRRWIFGVAKHKVVDYHRRAGRESFDLPDVEGTAAPHLEADLLRWAERNLPEGTENQKTLDWMLREGEGEKLESIAASEKLPPPRVRQRVSRLRRHFKENWQREVALLAALGVIISAVVLFVLKKEDPNPIITHEVVDPRAEPLRRLALERCAKNEWQPCVDGLDEARRLDPAGDKLQEVARARQAASSALQSPPVPETTPAPSAIPLTPAPEESAPRKMEKAPTKPTSTEPSFGSPSPSSSALPFDTKESKPGPSKHQGKAARPSGKPAMPSKGGSMDFGSDSDFGGSSSPAPSKKKGASNTK